MPPRAAGGVAPSTLCWPRGRGLRPPRAAAPSGLRTRARLMAPAPGSSLIRRWGHSRRVCVAGLCRARIFLALPVLLPLPFSTHSPSPSSCRDPWPAGRRRPSARGGLPPVPAAVPRPSPGGGATPQRSIALRCLHSAATRQRPALPTATVAAWRAVALRSIGGEPLPLFHCRAVVAACPPLVRPPPHVDAQAPQGGSAWRCLPPPALPSNAKNGLPHSGHAQNTGMPGEIG